MKRHILSLFGEVKTIDNKVEISNNGPTILTESIENSDEDGFFEQYSSGLIPKQLVSSDPTIITFTKESTDEDSFEPAFI